MRSRKSIMMPNSNFPKKLLQESTFAYDLWSYLSDSWCPVGSEFYQYVNPFSPRKEDSRMMQFLCAHENPPHGDTSKTLVSITGDELLNCWRLDSFQLTTGRPSPESPDPGTSVLRIRGEGLPRETSEAGAPRDLLKKWLMSMNCINFSCVVWMFGMWVFIKLLV